MKSKFKSFKFDWALFSIICFTIIYLLQFNWVFFIADEPKMLWMGKKCMENPRLFLSFEFSNENHDYYRPLERLLWGLDYYFFKTNPIPLQIFKRFLFFSVVIMIYFITKDLGGRWAGAVSAVLIFEYPIFRRYIDTLFVSRTSGVFLYLIAVSLLCSWIKYPKWNKLVMSSFFSFLAFMCKEELGVIYLFLMLTLIFIIPNSKKKMLMLVSLIFSLVIVAILTIDIFALERVRSFLRSNYLTKGSAVSTLWVSISDNFRYYMLEELSIRFFILLCFSIYITFKFFKRASHLMFLLPALGGFILILPLSFHPYHYFMSAYLNFVIFVSVSLGLFFKEKIFKKIKELTLGFFLNTTLAVLFVIMFILDVPSAIDKFRGLRHFTFVSSYPRKKAVLELLSFLPFSTVYIPTNWEAKQYYGDWLKIYGIEKIIKLQPLTFQNINEIVEGDNLVKNCLFQDKLKFWKIEGSGLTVKVKVRERRKGYMLGIEKLKKEVVNFSGLTQDIQIDPNATYVFGSWIKVNNFSRWTNLKIKEVNIKKYTSTFGMGGLEGISNWRLLYAFYKPSQNVKEVKFIIAHVPCFKRGEVWIWHPFFYKLKSGVKFLNYNF